MDIKRKIILIKIMTLTELFFIISNFSILCYIIFERLITSNTLDIKYLNDSKRKRILVTGGAGFVGSNLVDRLMKLGHEVIVIDNMFTGRTENCQHWIGHPHFRLIYHDITQPIYLEVDEIYHLACPASPPHYKYNLIN